MLDYAKTKEDLKKVFSKYSTQLEKLTKLLAKLETYESENMSKDDSDSSEDRQSSNDMRNSVKKDLYVIVKHNLTRAEDDDNKKNEEK